MLPRVPLNAEDRRRHLYRVLRLRRDHADQLAGQEVLQGSAFFQGSAVMEILGVEGRGANGWLSKLCSLLGSLV